MGQLHGKAGYLQAAVPFLNASERDVNALWESFNDVAEGFGLTQDEMAEICRTLMPSLEIHARADMDQLSIGLFTAFDTDENGLVDALEFLGTMAVASAMTTAQKLTFVYNCYDFNETGQVSIDELTLALRSTLTGLCKLCAGITCPSELELEDLALHAFQKASKTGPDDFLTLPEFLFFADTIPEMTSWVDYFDSTVIGNGIISASKDGSAEDKGDDIGDDGISVEEHAHGLSHHMDDIDPTSFATRDAVLLARKRDWALPLDARAPSFVAAADDTPTTLPSQPWQAVVSNATPSAPPTINPALPSASLALEWVYGFNSDLRSVVQYISPAEIVFPAGALVVIYDSIEHKQRFVRHHAGLVQVLAVHPTNRRIVASGERAASGAAYPSVAVWSADAPDAAPLSVIRGFHSAGIAHLAWMPNGRTLVTIGQDEFQCVAVYQWDLIPSAPGSSTQTKDASHSVAWRSSPTLIFSDRCGRAPVLACVVQSNHQFVTCGTRHIFFWLRESTDRFSGDSGKTAVFAKRAGVLGRRGDAIKTKILLSLVTMPSDQNIVIAGSARGHLLVFEGRNCIRVIHAHASSVNALSSFPGGILSAGADGKLRLWSKRLEPGAQFDIDALGSVAPGIRSITSSPDGGAKLLVATAGAEVFEMSASDGANLHFGALLSGHYAFELHSLVTHPTRPNEFCSVGDDRTVRIWDMATHRLLRMALLDAPTRACAYSPDGALLAIGYGAVLGDIDANEESGAEKGVPKRQQQRQLKLINPNKQGAFAVLSESTLTLKYEAKDAKRPIRTVRFSGDGLTLAVGSSDNCIYAYNTDDWASRGRCKARDPNVVLSSFDFASSGEQIMANARNKGEMVFFEASSGVEITRIATLKDVEWLTCTCPFGWSVQGAWPTVETAQSYEVYSVDRSSSSRSDATLLAAGDTFGTVRLFRYPCVTSNSLAHIARAATSTISCLRFNSDSNCLLTIARDERCIFQWSVETEELDEVMGVNEYEYHATSDDEVEMSSLEAPSTFCEAAALGDFALDILHQRSGSAETNRAGAEPAAPQPLKPWVGSSVAPTNAPPDERHVEMSSVPSDSIELEWVYGYRCHDARNNVFLSKARSLLIYPSANVVVIQDTKLWLQRHFKHHTGEVLSLVAHFSGVRNPGKTPGANSSKASLEIAASGQRGSYPAIYVWRIDSLEVLATLRGFHRRGIAELRFNSTGTLLASVGLDDRNTLAIYDWQNSQLLASASTNLVGRMLGMSFQQDEEGQDDSTAPVLEEEAVLVTVGVKTVIFWRLPAVRASNLLKKEGILGKKGMTQTFLSAVFCGKDAIVGTVSGDLYRFKGIALSSVVPAHSRGVAALYCVPKAPHQIVSGGKDGLVKLWSADLECLREFGEFNSAGRHPIRSVFWDFDHNTLAVGTRGSCIYLLSAQDGSSKTGSGGGNSESAGDSGTPAIPIVSGHWRYELHGLSVCARKERFCTTGDDGFLRVWDLVRHIQVIIQALDTSSRACAYSHDGQSIAIGLGSGSGASRRHKKDGSLLVFDEHSTSVELVYETRDAKQSISVIRYSPDDQSLVVGALDNTIYIYDVPTNYTKRAVFAKHKSAITHIDISSDSQYLRSNCGGSELLFADMTTGSHVASATALRDQQWATCSTIYNWSNQGVWTTSNATAAQQMQVTSSAASYTVTLGETKEGGDHEESLVVAGNSHGLLNLFRYPCFVKDAGYKSYVGHNGPIAEVSFAGNAGAAGGATHCISIGRTDRCVFQWRRRRAHVSDPGSNQSAPMVVSASDTSMSENDDPAIAAEGLFVLEAFTNEQTDEIKPYLSSLVAPSEPPVELEHGTGDAAGCTFELEYAFGFRENDVRGNAAYSAGKHVMFHTGCLGVRYDRRSHSQTFYRGHLRPIVSLATTKDGGLVATGEICAESFENERPRIHIWDPATCSRVAVLTAVHARAIRSLVFSNSRKLLASVGQDEHHTIAVFRSASALWTDATLLCTSKTTRRAVLFIAFLDEDENSGGAFDLMSGGEGHVTFWKLDPPFMTPTAGTLRGAHVANVASTDRLVALCGASMGALAVTGTASGHLLVWEAGVLTRAIPAHDGSVYALHATSKGCVSGGRDGHVKIWSRSCAPVADIDMMATLSPLSAPTSLSATGVSSVCWDVAEDRVLIGMRTGTLLELSRLTGSTSTVIESHCGSASSTTSSELHGLSAHPKDPFLVATAGEDSMVRVWNVETRQVVTKVALDGPLHCITYSPDGAWLAVGFGATNEGAPNAGHKHGAFAVLDATTLELVHQGRDAKQSALDVRFSPDQTLMALATADRAVYFYSPLDAFALRFKFAKASSRVTRMDFSLDGSALRLSSAAGELLFVRTLDGSQITSPSALRDVAWASHACLYSWEAQGVWDRPDERVLALTRAHTRALLAAATDAGELRVYNLPSLSKQSAQRALRGHALVVSNAAFTSDDSRLVSIGAHDRSLLVWKVF